MRCLPSSIFIFIFKFFFNEPIWLAHHSKTMKLEWHPYYKKSISKYKIPPFGPGYRLKQDNICQSIWDKSEVLLGSFWGESMPGTWELFAWTPQPHPKKKKKRKETVWKVHCQVESEQWTLRSPPNTTWENHPLVARPPKPPKE
jgi:hypothetical protein